MSEDNKKVLIYGASGWIGGLTRELLESKGHTVVASKARLQYLKQIEEELDTVKPDMIINAAGKTGRPNIDWCEVNREETVLANVLGSINLQMAAAARHIHCTHFVTGCIYHYTKDGPHSIQGGVAFTEEDPPNFTGSFYSKTKMHLEQLLLATFPSAPMLLLRVRLPLGDDLNPRSVITKLLGYEFLVNIPNSITVLHNCLPIGLRLAQQGVSGVFNFTNEGSISHKELMQIYKEEVDPAVTWKHFTLEEQDKVCKAPRSNTLLDVSKLKAIAPDLLPVRDAVRQAMKLVKQNLDKEKEKQGKEEK